MLLLWSHKYVEPCPWGLIKHTNCIMNFSVTLQLDVKEFKYAKSNQELVKISYSTNYEI
jgi:hypothetical protein